MWYTVTHSVSGYIQLSGDSNSKVLRSTGLFFLMGSRKNVRIVNRLECGKTKTTPFCDNRGACLSTERQVTSSSNLKVVRLQYNKEGTLLFFNFAQRIRATCSLHADHRREYECEWLFFFFYMWPSTGLITAGIDSSSTHDNEKDQCVWNQLVNIESVVA